MFKEKVGEIQFILIKGLHELQDDDMIQKEQVHYGYDAFTLKKTVKGPF